MARWKGKSWELSLLFFGLLVDGEIELCYLHVGNLGCIIPRLLQFKYGMAGMLPVESVVSRS